MLDSVAVTLPRTPLRPLTAMLEGYGNALVLSRILIKVVFEKVWTSGRVKLKLTRPRLFAPSCSCRTAGLGFAFGSLGGEGKGRPARGTAPAPNTANFGLFRANWKRPWVGR